MEGEQETASKLSNGTSLSDLQWPFQGHDYSMSSNLKMVQHRGLQLYLQWPTIAIESRIWSIERRHFQWLWTTPTSSFRVTPYFDAECFRNGTTYRHSVIEILITRALRNSVILNGLELSDLAKYSMTRSVTRSLRFIDGAVFNDLE